VEAALLGFLIDLGAQRLAAAGDDVDRGFLAALQPPDDRLDQAILDQRLQALGYFHAARSVERNRAKRAAA